MNNLWVFGDSFAYLHPQGDTWTRQVARSLNQELQCYARGGTSLEYTYEQFNRHRLQIQEYDTVIVALTEINRRWLVRNIVDENIWMIVNSNYDMKLTDAIKQYLVYLDNPAVYETYLTNFLYSLEYITKRLKLKTVILPCFESSTIANKFDLITAQGNLFDISTNEFMPTFTNRHSITQISDLRANHMIHSNHKILAAKIVNAITDNTHINLHKDFVQHILNETSLRDPMFANQELFDIHLNHEQWNLHSF